MSSIEVRIIKLFNKLVDQGYEPIQAQDIAISEVLVSELNDRKNDTLWEQINNTPR